MRLQFEGGREPTLGPLPLELLPPTNHQQTRFRLRLLAPSNHWGSSPAPPSPTTTLKRAGSNVTRVAVYSPSSAITALDEHAGSRPRSRPKSRRHLRRRAQARRRVVGRAHTGRRRHRIAVVVRGRGRRRATAGAKAKARARAAAVATLREVAMAGGKAVQDRRRIRHQPAFSSATGPRPLNILLTSSCACRRPARHTRRARAHSPGLLHGVTNALAAR